MSQISITITEPKGAGEGARENRDDRDGLCRAGVGVCFSDFGHDVVCVDKDPDKIAKLDRGEVPIYEPGLDALMEKNVAAGRLSFTTDLAGGGGRGRRGVHRRRHADAARRRARRPDLRHGRRRGGRPRADRVCRDRHQVHRAGGHQPQGQAGHRSPRPTRRPNSTSPRTPSSCARAPRSRIS